MNVIITGATRGIGRAMAEKFAREGHSIITCARNNKELQQLKDDLLKINPLITVRLEMVDIGEAKEVKDFAKWIIASGLTADILINNAGYFVPGSIHSENDETFYKMMEVNLNSAYHLTKALLPSMMNRRSGHIFNICSIAAFQPLPNVGSYGISKFALLGLTKHLREEMKPYGIKVTAVCPGATFTSSWEGSNIDPERIVEAQDVAAVVYAASQLSKQAVVEDIIIRPQLGDL